MRDFSYGGYKYLGSGEKEKGDRELSIKDHLIERLEQRFKERQTSLRFITVGSLAMALSACKNDALVLGSDGNDVFGNTSASEIFKGRLGNDVWNGYDHGHWRQ